MKQNLSSSKSLWKKPNLNLLLIILLFGIIAVSPYTDIAFSKLFYHNNQFLLNSGFMAWMLHYGFQGLLILSGLSVLFLWLLGFIKNKQWILGVNTPVMLFIFGSLLLGPIIIVNGLFKTFWGRARPYEVMEFGGLKYFTPPMVITNQCNLDCSFMSGHTAMGFWVICFAFLTPCRWRKTAIISALIFGSLLGLARIAAGFHFFSDVFFSAVVTISVVRWLHYKIFPNDYKKC